MKQHSYRFRLRQVAVVAALALGAHSVWAVEPFDLRDIKVEGLQRIEAGTVFASLPFRVGESYTDEKGTAAIRALYALGLFKEVRLEVEGNVLTVIVEERPNIASVEFVGTKEFDKDVLLKSLRDVGLAEGRPFDKALADRAEQELKRQYINRSLYGAEVVTTVTPVDRNRVNLTFTVTEGTQALIREIHIVGNRSFSESELLDLFDQDTGGWFSFYTKSNRYSRTKFNADLETLRSHYLARGYMEFRIDSTQVALSPDKQGMAITVNVTEGDRFVVAGVKLEGNYLDKVDDFKSLVTIKPGEAYNVESVTETVKAFTEVFGNFGFAFAKVEVKPEIDRSTNRVTLVLQADPGQRASVRRINISGNERTRDQVIRREFRQNEASWYDGSRIRASRDRVDRLGFFTDVGIDTAEVPGTPDQVDLNVTVAEKPTGSIQLGAGFSTSEKMSLSFSIKQENAFGSGNYLGIELNTSKYNRVLAVNTTDPYYTDDGISRTWEVFHRTTKPYADQGGNYELVTMGGSLRFGVPFSEMDTVYLGAGLEQTTIKSGTSIPAFYLDYANRYGDSSTSLPLTLGWSRDDRDSALIPTKGRYQRFNAEWAVAGDARYLKGSYQYQHYIPLNRQFTVAFNTELGLGKGLNGRDFPVFKNFYAGGLGSVRGFEQSTLGPRDVTGSFTGGTKKVVLNGELISPFPGVGNDRTLRMYGFADIGNVYGENERVDMGQMRASVGYGISWISPLGPLRLGWSKPVRKFAGDRIQKLQFQIGTSF